MWFVRNNKKSNNVLILESTPVVGLEVTLLSQLGRILHSLVLCVLIKLGATAINRVDRRTLAQAGNLIE